MQEIISTQALKAHFDSVMARRGVNVAFERFETASITNDGNRLHVDVISVAQQAPTIVFVPGTSVYGLVFANYLNDLADQGFNIVSFDPRGHGRSEGLRGSYTVSELVSDARAAIEFAKSRFDGPVFIAGSSQGGIVAFYTAVASDDLHGAFCHNAAELTDPQNHRLTDRPILSRIIRPITLGLAKLFPNAGINVKKYYALLSKGNEEIKARMEADPLSLKVIRLRALASLATTPLPRPLDQVSTPIMFIHGEDDDIFPRDYVENIYHKLPGKKAFKLYPGHGHFICTEQQGVDTIVPDIVAFAEEQLGHSLAPDAANQAGEAS